MIRLFIDKLGSGHQDIFLKIEGMPDYLAIADSYFLDDFLESRTGQTISKKVIELIQYWKEEIISINKGQDVFLPFDFSDQYIGGLNIEKTKLGYLITSVWTEQIHGYNITKSSLIDIIKKQNVDFKLNDERSWLISEQGIMEGFDLSLDQLR